MAQAVRAARRVGLHDKPAALFFSASKTTIGRSDWIGALMSGLIWWRGVGRTLGAGGTVLTAHHLLCEFMERKDL